MMNIFQTIWTALTTENAVLTNLVIIPLYFIEAYVSMKLFSVVLNINSTKKQQLIYVLVMSLASIITKFLLPTPYSTYINLISMILIIMFVHKVNFFKAILALFIACKYAVNGP